MERPATSWRTFGLADFIRVPSPAARTTARQVRPEALEDAVMKLFIP
jgi:hypothetical protein